MPSNNAQLEPGPGRRKATRSSVARIRPAALWVHRWVGLVMAGFLLVAGVTGSIIAFYGPLDAALNPELFRVTPPTPGAPLLDALELQARVREHAPQEELHSAILDLREGRSVNYWLDEHETFFDPYTGRWLGSRVFGQLGQGKRGFLTFIYRFHFSLALGDVGMWLFGVVAVLWTIDCFVGAYLTFPLAMPAGGRARVSWFARWGRAWGIETKQLFALVFTWHRASGLWIWGMLLVFAWSAVALNLGESVYHPVMNLVARYPAEAELPVLEPPRVRPRLGLAEARERGRLLMASEAERRAFGVLREKYLEYDPEHGVYVYTVETTEDIDERLPETALTFDGDDGRFVAFRSLGTGGVRNVIDRWLIALHFGAVRAGGVWYRAFVCLAGVMVGLLSVTGVWIWWRKRSKRVRNEARRSARVGTEPAVSASAGLEPSSELRLEGSVRDAPHAVLRGR